MGPYRGNYMAPLLPWGGGPSWRLPITYCLGKVAEMQQLLALAADPSLRNRQGLTALDVVRIEFGGAVPTLLQELLDRQTPV